MITISQDQLINIIHTSDISFLLGAGCSISSGCMSAKNLAYEFKKMIYCNQMQENVSKFDYLSDDLKDMLDNYFIDVKTKNEYSYYFEKCYPTKNARMEFIKNYFYDKKPSVGYLCFAKVLLEKCIKNVYTTNFDNLIEKAVRNIDINYDITKTNEKQQPLTQNKLTITELHGDYNYSEPRNTEEELKVLGEKTKKSILSCPATVLIVMGYSGADDSVMNALREYVNNNKASSIIWCAYNGQTNKEVDDLMTFANSINEDSCLCDFKGFDELFLNYYSQYLEKDPNIDKTLEDKPTLNFSSDYLLNKKEILLSNLFEITSLPRVYCVENVGYSKELIDRINEIYIGQIHKNNLYFIGNLDWLEQNFHGQSVKEVKFDINFINQFNNISIKLLKDFISKGILENNTKIKKQKRKFYFENEKDANNIYEGFSIDIHLLNKRVYLSFIQEFVYENDLNQFIKNQILKKSKAIRNNSASIWLSNLINKIGYKFFIWDSSLEYKEESLCLSDLDYTLLEEPSVTTSNIEKNISALQSISKSGVLKPAIPKEIINIEILTPLESRLDLSKYFKNLNTTIDSTDGIYPNYMGFEKMFNVKIKYEVTEYSISDCKNFSFFDYCKFILSKLENINQIKHPDLTIIYIPNCLEMFEFSDASENNLHDYVKLHSAGKYVTQFITEKSIHSSDVLYKKIWNLAIAIYTKTIALPWQPSKYSQTNAFVGIGYGITGNGMVVGCSQMFDSQGKGLQLLLKPISSHSKNPFMSEMEAYNVGKSLSNIYYGSYPTHSLKNVTIHKSTPFKKAERKGLEKAFSHVENLELIQIEEKNSIKAIKYASSNELHGYPLSRGTLIKISDNEALLWTHGAVISRDFNRGREYVKGGKGYPSPLLLRRFKGKLPLEEVASNILMLTKMDYNSADILYSNMPVTIKYTSKAIDIIKQDKISLEEIDFRFII